VKECTAGDIKLLRRYTAKQAREWTEYDSWKLCHPKAARDCAVKWTQDYYEHSDRVGKKIPYEGKQHWPEDGFEEKHYIGKCRYKIQYCDLCVDTLQ
jgi:hypothetical protein